MNLAPDFNKNSFLYTHSITLGLYPFVSSWGWKYGILKIHVRGNFFRDVRNLKAGVANEAVQTSTNDCEAAPAFGTRISLKNVKVTPYTNFHYSIFPLAGTND